MSKKSRRTKTRITRTPSAKAPAAARAQTEWLNNKLRVVAGFGLLMVAYYWLISRFFPNEKGLLGSDYAYFLPSLLDGYYWFHTNGFFQVPWFTPSFCGGSLVFPNLQRSFYSFPQFLTFLVNPLTAVRITVFVFAFLGGAGCYLLLRRAFRVSRWTAFLGGGLFLFNGFYSHRMIIGHFGYHPFMLLPLVALFLLRPKPADTGAPLLERLIFDAAVAGIFIAIMATSDFVTLLIPALLSVVVLGLVHGLLYGQHRYFWGRFSLACSIAVLLSLAKLTAIVAFMKHAPRSGYLLPGVDSLFHAFMLVPRCLFLGAELDPLRDEWVRNAQWRIGQHEWEYSVSLVPLVFFLLGCMKVLARSRRGVVTSILSRLKMSDWISVSAIFLIALMPILLNVYSPGWNAFLKEIPVIQSSSVLFRWFILYIPCVILSTALIMDRSIPRNFQGVVCIGSLIFCLAIKASRENSYYYTTEPYNPRPILEAYNRVRLGILTPEISSMGMYQDDQGKPQIPVDRNNTFTQGISQILAYESLFGYRLEYLPFKTLHPGPALDTSKGVLNVKNPASYLWPDENHCEPGDHFKIGEKAAAQAFLHYKPFPFQMSLLQKVADWINVATLVAVGVFLSSFLGRKLYGYLSTDSARFVSNSSGSPLKAGHQPGTVAG